jgi:predicted CXXCH cytochrome family protein
MKINCHIMLFRIKPASIGLMLLVFSGLFFMSCDEAERYETLTFFFDGVPPPGSTGLQGEPLDSNSLELDQTGQTPAWYVHEPRKDCTTCHGKRKQRGFSSETYLIAQEPELCYNCHDDYTVSAPFVHGPVAVGQCLFCHNPHKSKVEHLLKEAEPGLCYLCHDVNTIELIAAHLPDQLSSCTNCHNPHSSSIKALLKETSSRIDDESTRTTVVDRPVQNYISIDKGQNEQAGSEPTASASSITPQSKILSEVFQQVRKLIEQGELRKAGAYLDKFKDNNAFTAEERRLIERILKMIDDVTTGTEKQLNKRKQGQTAAKSGNSKNQSDRQIKETADLYYRSMAFYRAGQLSRAREGFAMLLRSGLIPESMAKTIRGYLSDIDNSLAKDKARQ